MPKINPLTIPSSVVDATEIYTSGVYRPQYSPGNTFEVLNGNLTKENWQNGDGLGSAETLKPYMMQLGNFARGYYHGFDRIEYVYGYQTSGGKASGEDKKTVYAGLSANVFIGFRPRAVMYGVQGWFQHDATEWPSGTVTKEEWCWVMKIQGGGTTYSDQGKALRGKLPHGRYNTTTDLMPEDRWRYIHKTGMIPSSKGIFENDYFSISFELSGVLSETYKQGNAKCKAVTGGIWILAMR